MSLAKLDIHHVRNIEQASLAPSPTLNLIIGANGSGKTSLLEALYILGRGRSFRSTQASQIINFSQDTLTVTGKTVTSPSRAPMTMGVQLSRQGREMSISGRKLQTSAALISVLPVMLIQPSTVALLDDAPKFRRRFLDWGAFHVEQKYMDFWRGYIRALHQRNALLKAGDVRNISLWDVALADYGSQLASCRNRFTESLKPYFVKAATTLIGIADIDLTYQCGWNKNCTLHDALKADLSIDRRMGYTHSGPHKADFSITVNGRYAKAFFSRGQLKLLVYALCIAQAQMIKDYSGIHGCMLVDDVTSELDQHNKENLLNSLIQPNLQLFVTGTHKDLFSPTQIQHATVFHVEHGEITQD